MLQRNRDNRSVGILLFAIILSRYDVLIFSCLYVFSVLSSNKKVMIACVGRGSALGTGGQERETSPPLVRPANNTSLFLLWDAHPAHAILTYYSNTRLFMGVCVCLCILFLFSSVWLYAPTHKTDEWVT